MTVAAAASLGGAYWESNRAMDDRNLRKLVVSIINYRTGPLTIQCLEAVAADCATLGQGTATVEAVVVDNASGDGSAETIQERISAGTLGLSTQLVRSETNSGFSGGHNQAIGAVPADFYLLLNSDAMLRPGAIAALLGAAERHPAAGLLAPRIEYEDGTVQISCFRFASPLSELIRGAASGPLTRLLARHEVPLAMPPDPEEIEWASFACILLRGDMVRQVGLLDDGYFLYFEDAEYCLRAGRAGFRVVYVPEARVVHLRGRSGPVKTLARANARLPAYYHASRTRFLYQAHGRLGLFAANAAWMLGRCIAWLRPLGGQRIPPVAPGQWRDLWINFRTPLGDRRAREN